MEFDPDILEPAAIYKLLTGTIIPRPIGWISSISGDGINNLAPFSFFNAVGEDPPHVMFSTVRTGDKNKDTLNNVLETKEFVVNLVTEEIVEKMNMTSEAAAPEIDEFQLAGLTPVPSVKIKPMRVQESAVNLECQLVHHYSLEDHKNGGATILIGRIVLFHVNPDIMLDGYKINLEKYKPVARLAGSNYATLGDIFSIKRK
ncbi:MAG: flavin reductase family protein [Flavobacterium sp.]|nr:flavin reductase family protein [Flavobacterium sp.]